MEDDNYEKGTLGNIRIIYLNSLISLDNEEEEEKLLNEYLIRFNNNPKYYIKLKKFINEFKDKYLNQNQLYDDFLEFTYSHIKEKIDKYYKSKMSSILSGESIIDLIEIQTLVEKKINLSGSLIIHYIEKFPFKYLKIMKKDSDENIIEINNNFHKHEYNFQYVFPFIGAIFAKIIYMNENKNVINFSNLNGSAIGSFLEEKIKKTIVYNDFFKKNINLRYVWNFSPATPKEKIIDKKIDYLTFKEIQLDDCNKDFQKLIKNGIYYIIPNSQIIRSLDSALLIPGERENEYILITFQITKGKDEEMKQKDDYIRDSFLAKIKFEKIYKIKITDVYFHFIIPKEFETDKTVENLNKQKISYFYYSIRNESFVDFNNNIYKFVDLINLYSLIEQFKSSNEDKNFLNKIGLIESLEYFLQKKTKVTQKMYENGKKFIFNKDKGIKLSKEEKMKIISCLKKQYKIDYNFTIQYIFKIHIE